MFLIVSPPESNVLYDELRNQAQMTLTRCKRITKLEAGDLEVGTHHYQGEIRDNEKRRVSLDKKSFRI